MADRNASGSASPNQTRMQIEARRLGERLPQTPDIAYIVIAVHVPTGDIGWVSQIVGERLTELLGNMVATMRH